MWLWNRDSEFTEWQHPAMWYVALEWHAIEFAQTFAILEFYIHLASISTTSPQSTCHSAPVTETLSKSDHPGQKKMTSCHVIQDCGSQPSWILVVPLWVLWKAHVRLPIGRQQIVLIAEFLRKSRFCILATDKQTNKQTDEQTDSTEALSRSRCLERRINNENNFTGFSYKKITQIDMSFLKLRAVKNGFTFQTTLYRKEATALHQRNLYLPITISVINCNRKCIL